MVKKNKTKQNFNASKQLQSNMSRRGGALKKVGNIVGHSVDKL